MAKRYCTIALLVSLFFFIGCQSNVESGTSRVIATRTGTSPSAVNVAEKGEIDLVDQVTVNRDAYRQGLDSLIRYYTKVGNNAKLEWAKKELSALNVIPQYSYIVITGTSDSFRPVNSITDADLLYDEAKALQKQAMLGSIVINKDKLRQALDIYEQLIKKYPTSDRIDDAAYESGDITFEFKDYTIALEYYQRVYQWDRETTYPARFKAARIMDKQMHRFDDALKLYKQAIETEGKYSKNLEWKNNAEERVKALEKIDQ
jgi:tetratricopeptide (TPR) repeat protein